MTILASLERLASFAIGKSLADTPIRLGPGPAPDRDALPCLGLAVLSLERLPGTSGDGGLPQGRRDRPGTTWGAALFRLSGGNGAGSVTLPVALPAGPGWSADIAVERPPGYLLRPEEGYWLDPQDRTMLRLSAGSGDSVLVRLAVPGPPGTVQDLWEAVAMLRLSAHADGAAAADALLDAGLAVVLSCLDGRDVVDRASVDALIDGELTVVSDPAAFNPAALWRLTGCRTEVRRLERRLAPNGASVEVTADIAVSGWIERGGPPFLPVPEPLRIADIRSTVAVLPALDAEP